MANWIIYTSPHASQSGADSDWIAKACSVGTWRGRPAVDTSTVPFERRHHIHSGRVETTRLSNKSEGTKSFDQTRFSLECPFSHSLLFQRGAERGHERHDPRRGLAHSSLPQSLPDCGVEFLLRMASGGVSVCDHVVLQIHDRTGNRPHGKARYYGISRRGRPWRWTLFRAHTLVHSSNVEFSKNKDACFLDNNIAEVVGL